jgi:D-alanyl-D-alanine carboxypeptidase
MTTRILGIVVAVACSIGGTAEATTNLKPFDPAALQSVVEATAKELLLPGVMVLLRTPKADLTFGYGATELGGTTSPRAETHFRAASNTKTTRKENCVSTIRSRNMLRAFRMGTTSRSVSSL